MKKLLLLLLLLSGNELFAQDLPAKVVPATARDESPQNEAPQKEYRQNESPQNDAEQLGLLAIPTPADRSLRVAFSLPRKMDIGLTLLNMQGRVMYQEAGISLEAGGHARSLGYRLLPGTYVRKLRGPGLSASTVVVNQ